MAYRGRALTACCGVTPSIPPPPPPPHKLAEKKVLHKKALAVYTHHAVHSYMYIYHIHT